MVHDLPDRPTIGSVRRIELLVREVLDGVSQLSRQAGDFVDRGCPLLRGHRSTPLEAAHRVAELFEVSCHRLLLFTNAVSGRTDSVGERVDEVVDA